MEPLRTGFVWKGGDAAVRELEALPIDSLWVGGHIAAPRPTNEAMVQLARLSALAHRVRLGTSILLLPLYPPAIVAKQILDLDRVTDGRITLGIGVGGEYPQEFRACGVPVHERGGRVNEAMPLLRRLWTGETVTHQGRYFDLADVCLGQTPVQPGGPPIVVSGRKPAAMRRAARLGDGWLPYLYSPERYADSVAQIRSFAADEGRDLTDFEWMAYVFVSLRDDEEQARRDAVALLGAQYAQDFDAFLDRVAAVGTVRQVAERLRAFVDAGARHFVLMPCQTGAEFVPTAQRLMAEVMPFTER